MTVDADAGLTRLAVRSGSFRNRIRVSRLGDPAGTGFAGNGRAEFIHDREFKDRVSAHHMDAASMMILPRVASTSCATSVSCGVLNIASRVVGFKVARVVLPSCS